MRILAIAPTAFYNDYGCHVRIAGQLRSLQARGHVIRLVTYPVGSDAPGLEVVRAPLPGLRHIPVGSSRRKLILDAILAPTAAAAALHFRPHIIHAYLHEGALIGWLLAQMLRVPLSFDYQGSLTAEMIAHRFLRPHSLWLHPLQRLERWLELRPRAILASTRHALPTLRARGVPQSRLHHLPDAVDPERFAPQPGDAALARSLGLRPQTPTLVYLGLLAPYQGVDMLLQAIARLQRPVQLLVMGFPHVAHYRRMAADLGVGEQVHFSGPVPYQQAPRYLALGDLAIAPKLHTTEGSGKLPPYMSMALPIIATDTPAHRQYLGELGFYASPGAEHLAAAIEQALAATPRWQEIGAQLRARAQARYTWRHTAAQMEMIFENVVNVL